MIKENHASNRLRIARMDDEALPTLQLEMYTVLKDLHFGQGRRIRWR